MEIETGFERSPDIKGIKSALLNFVAAFSLRGAIA